MAPRLRSLTICGFRAYGRTPQILNLPSDIAAVWGPNSTGKSSLAEALEFLLTGRIARRELMAGSQDEFADALRNVHLGAADPTYVAAAILASDGKEHEVRRTLTRDYGKREDCQSGLEIDGAASDAAGLAALGIVLSQRPLEAPVLAQHTLGYLFSAGPQERATYFKTLLELNDLEVFRGNVAALVAQIRQPDLPAITKLTTCARITTLNAELLPLLSGAPDLPTVTSALEQSAKALLATAGQEVPGTLAQRVASIQATLASRRGKAFPVDLFTRTEPGSWTAPAQESWDRLRTYLDERSKVDAEVGRLVALFEQALQLPQVANANSALDCPLCATKASLSPARVAFLRQQVQQTRSFASAESTARSMLQQLVALAQACVATAKSSLPGFLTCSRTERRQRGFSSVRIREVLADAAEPLLPPWSKGLRPLLRAAADLRAKADEVVARAPSNHSDLANLADIEEIVAAFADLQRRRNSLVEASRKYEAHAKALRLALDGVLDARADTKGWQDFIDLASDVDGLHAALLDRAANDSVTKEMEQALREIDAAKERVLDDKFGEYSDLVKEWWERLRPGEPAFFSTVRPRRGAKRTIDIKAELSPHEDRSAPKMRDAIAIFSQSQIHCLGLALFLARAQRDEVGFILLDDPVLSSDDDYRVNFRTSVLEAVVGIPMQVIVVTQSHETWKDLDVRFRHQGIATAQLMILNVADGSVVENTSDQMRAIISRAQALARNGHPDVRKECGVQLRTAGERFCKEVLVRDKVQQGDQAASVIDYDGKALEWLVPRTTPLLKSDPSHPGKLESLKNTLNPSCHDDAPPSCETLVSACGDLQHLLKQYLPSQVA